MFLENPEDEVDPGSSDWSHYALQTWNGRKDLFTFKKHDSAVPCTSYTVRLFLSSQFVPSGNDSILFPF